MDVIRTFLRKATTYLKLLKKTMLDTKNERYVIVLTLLIVFSTFLILQASERKLQRTYEGLESVAILDRNGKMLALYPNEKGAYAIYKDEFPERVKELLIKKEDRFFYFHPGINPFSAVRAGVRYVIGHNIGGASTITQQLAKNLLGNEQKRSIANKIVETFYAFALELFASKEEILTMYANTVYMGNQVQGLSEASKLYFGKELEELDDTKLAMLLSTISSPSVKNPWREENARSSRNLALRLRLAFDPKSAVITDIHEYRTPRYFELSSMGVTCAKTCVTTIDSALNEELRRILQTHVEKGFSSGARNGAIVVLKLPENEILAIVGTPYQMGLEAGQQINMALEPRPIGSTAKPFIYLAGFEKGLRPYTLVNDREYKFPTAAGYALYPKNYDGRYRGWVTLHAALSNSLNVPSVKTLQFVGLSSFYDFLQRRLHFVPLQELDSYQYGIALGGLEMDPLTLAHYLSLFPQNGTLKPLTLFVERPHQDLTYATAMSPDTDRRKIAEPKYAQLVSRILNDRAASVEQFGLASNLNLFQNNYAVKTGTSRDYHDSWTVGYTPDLLVVAWLGNAENTPLRHVTGQSGAGAIWNDSMELLLNSEYNKKTPLSFDETEGVFIDGSLDFGLPGENVAEHRNLLRDDVLIISPQDNDTFLREENIRIPLISSQDVSWFVSGESLGEGFEVSYMPQSANTYSIQAVHPNGASQSIRIHVIDR